MKHSRNELVGSYMKRRRYSDNENFKKSDLTLIRSSGHMALSSLVDNESTHLNSIMYSCINNDPSVAEAQFIKFKTWLNEIKSSKVVEELKVIVFPLVCHLYIEMLRGGHKTAAASFLKRHQTISNEEHVILMLEELATIENTKEIDDKDIIQKLRSSKYMLTLSPLSLEILKQYLINKSHVILLQIINCWLDLDEAQKSEDLLIDHNDLVGNSVACNGYSEHIQHTDSDLAKLEEIIRLVKHVPASSSPLLLYSVKNPDNSMTCGHVSNDTTLLAAGFNTSDVKVWSLTVRKLAPFRPCPGSRIRLAVDIDEEEEVDQSANLENPQLPQHVPSDQVTLRSHSGCVQDVAFIPREDLLISVSMDTTMRVWDLNNYTCRAVYRGHNYPIWCVDVSPLGVYLATGSHDRTARLWSLERNFPLRIFSGHVQDVDCLEFHPNGSYLATGSSDKSVRLWSISTGDLVRVLPGHRSGIYDVAFSPDGKHLASAGEDSRVKIWDLGSGNLVTELKGHSDTAVSLDWSPDGEFLASCSLDNTIRVWHVNHFSSDEEQSAQTIPHVYSLPNTSLFSIKYSQQNTPICIAGV